MRSPWAAWSISAALCLVGVGLVGLGMELHLRATTPFLTSNWPGLFDPEVGFVFQPGARVRQTNGIDYWVESQANRWGFLDREPPSTSTHTSCRVAIVGDSFVEATQVPLEERLQVQLEVSARRDGRHPIEAFALANSSTGQANQLPLYDRFARALAPDVVVLVFATNDFANNSHVLEALRNGWHPDHLPRVFFREDPAGSFSPIGIDPDWASFRLPAKPVELSRAQQIHQRLRARSHFYTWLFAHVSIQHPSWVTFLAGAPIEEVLADRLNAIEKIPSYERAFEGWRYPDDFDMDWIFCTADPLPPVFQDALEATGHALDQFLERSRRDGFTLLALSTYGITTNSVSPRFGRTPEPRGYRRRLEALLGARGIPLIDQHDYIQSTGGRIEDAYFSRDGHWSPQGHRWAAEALAAYLEAHPELCTERPAR